MDAFLRRDAAHRRDIFVEAGRRMSLLPASIEKDFWVCWTLRALFSLPGIGAHLTFKGGTSLSKCWKLIERFSEDIDVVVSRDYLGFGGDASPDRADGGKERKRRLDGLADAASASVRGTLLPALEGHVGASLPHPSGCRVELDPDAGDQQCILLYYATVVDASAYLNPVVRIELGARSDTEPHEEPAVTPYAAEVLPGEFTDAAFTVRAVAPERTFLEKMALLHEEGFAERGPRPRLARHYYDVFRLIESGVAARALADPALFDRVVEHRRTFFRKGGEAQTTLARGTLRLAPPPERRSAWKKDYDAMREAMFFGDPPSFDAIMQAVEAFEQRFNGAAV